MRLLILVLFLIVPFAAHAACDGRDLRLEMTAEDRRQLDEAVREVVFPEGNHWIARKDNTVLHLIGTLHTNDERMGAVIDRLSPQLVEADAFYFEVTGADMEAFEKNLANDFSAVMITSGPTLIDLMSDADWAALSASLAERGIPSWMAAKLQPWFLSMMLSIPPCLMETADFDRGMDTRLAEIADANGIDQFSLESIEDLIAMFGSHPIEDQVRSLVRLSGALHADDDQMNTMANAYLEEKHAELIQLAKIQGLDASGLTPEEFAEEWDAFEADLLIERNNNWMQKILTLEDQTAVIAVGAGHLGDDHGLLNQLQAAGYSLMRAPF